MHRILLAFQILLFAGWTYGDDVGSNYDPVDGKAWEAEYGTYPFRSYKTSNLTSPVVRRMVESEGCYDGRYMFAALRGDAVPNPEPMILDDKGHMVWAMDVSGRQPYNLQVQEYQGQPHLTMWLGNDAVGGHGEGYYHILNSSYHEVAKLSPRNGFNADLHELTITPEGTAIFSIYQKYPIIFWDRKVYIWDCLFQEIDIATNELLFEWRASDHHTLDETYSRIGSGGRNSHNPWDWYHINSVQKDHLGNYFVSARYTHTLTYIDGKTGAIIWILGGRRNMFQDVSNGAATDFASQHFARMHDMTEFPHFLSSEIKSSAREESHTEKLISIFDNGADDRIRVREYSRGLLLHVSYPSELTTGALPVAGELKRDHTVRLVTAYNNPDSISADSQGSFQVIPPTVAGSDATIGLGYGQRPVFTEYSADGRVICDTRFATKKSLKVTAVQSYRTFKHSWVGRPMDLPSVALSEDEDAVFVSWNGATEAKHWKLQHSDEARSTFEWKDLTTSPKQGFETRIKFRSDVRRYIRVIAIDRTGKELAASEAIDVGEIDFPTTTQFNTSMVIESKDEYNIMAAPTLPLKIVMFILCAVAFLLTVYACYRHYYNWRGYEPLDHDDVDDKAGGYSYA